MGDTTTPHSDPDGDRATDSIEQGAKGDPAEGSMNDRAFCWQCGRERDRRRARSVLIIDFYVGQRAWCDNDGGSQPAEAEFPERFDAIAGQHSCSSISINPLR